MWIIIVHGYHMEVIPYETQRLESMHLLLKHSVSIHSYILKIANENHRSAIRSAFPYYRSLTHSVNQLCFVEKAYEYLLNEIAV